MAASCQLCDETNRPCPCVVSTPGGPGSRPRRRRHMDRHGWSEEAHKEPIFASAPLPSLRPRADELRLDDKRVSSKKYAWSPEYLPTSFFAGMGTLAGRRLHSSFTHWRAGAPSSGWTSFGPCDKKARALRSRRMSVGKDLNASQPVGRYQQGTHNEHTEAWLISVLGL